REVRIQVAVGVPRALREGRAHGAARLGLRSGRDERVLRLRAEALARRDPLRRHRRLQRRQPRQGVRDELQSRDQHPRGHRALLPDPASLAENYTGKTSIGCLCEGVKNGKPKRYFIYNICDHAETYKEVRAQAVSYTTGVPAVTGATMMLTGKWRGAGVFNME